MPRSRGKDEVPRQRQAFLDLLRDTDDYDDIPHDTEPRNPVSWKKKQHKLKTGPDYGLLRTTLAASSYAGADTLYVNYCFHYTNSTLRSFRESQNTSQYYLKTS